MSNVARPASRPLAVLLAVSALAVAGCSSGGGEPSGSGSGGGGGGGGEGLTVWVAEDVPERVTQMEAIFADFTETSGVEVELVAVAEDQLFTLLTSAAAADELPDMLGSISLPLVRTLSANELLDTDVTASVLEELGEDTFTEEALALTRDGDTQLAVPSDSWSQLLFYRADLFEAAGLEPPTSYDSILAAAEALDSEEVAGFVGATAPGDAFTEQTFEHVALGNGCQLVDEEGEVQLDSPECVAALDFYGTLVQDYSVPGAQDVDTVRASYFAGQAAMFVWSTFVLDEMAGLREDALPTCPECAADPTFLATNTGVVSAIEGPDGGEPALFGEVSSWVVTAGADTGPAGDLITYMLGDGYVPWLAIAPEGKLPVRAGTAENPTEFADAWAGLPVGVDTEAPLSEVYPPEVLEALTAGPGLISRWAIPQGQGELLGATQGEQPVATAVNEVSTGTDPEQAAQTAAEAVRSLQ